jgi:hypothetical protein
MSDRGSDIAATVYDMKDSNVAAFDTINDYTAPGRNTSQA